MFGHFSCSVYVLPALAENFAPVANVWGSEYHVFHFVVASVLERGKCHWVLNILSVIVFRGIV